MKAPKDPFAAFGFEDAPAKASTAESAAGLPVYQAFEAKDRLKRLDIRHSGGMWHSPAYAYLLDIMTDGERGKEIALLYSFMLVKIRGKNLHPVTLALQNNGCAFIQDFDAKKFTTPPQGEPIIDSIEITVKE